MPALIVKAAQQGRQLGSDMDGFIARQAVAKGMQRRNQRWIDTSPVVPTQEPHEVVDPCFGRAGCGMKILHRCHGRNASLDKISPNARNNAARQTGVFNGLQISLALRKIKLPGHIPGEKGFECVRMSSIASTG